MAEEPMQWETDNTGHRTGYEGFGATTITVLGWIIVVLVVMYCLFAMGTGIIGTIFALIITSVVNIFASGFVKKLLL